ncbi:unnamed protein product [Effrenium voratum]|nr:unnamed protein product [Effrenium voratum]
MHAVACCICLYIAILLTGICADRLVANESRLGEAQWPAAVLVAYWCWMIFLRLRGETSSTAMDVYQLMWSCNVVMPVTAIAILLRRPALLCAQGIFVAIDQVLWYVDWLGYLLFGKFPVKVIAYLFWPTTPPSRRISSLHHVLFGPFVIWLGSRECCLPLGRGFVVSLAQTIVCEVICRYTTPLEVIDRNGAVCYMNLNLCYEAFRDVKVSWIRVFDRDIAIRYLPWMLWIWNAGNMGLFSMLAVILVPFMRLFGVSGGICF